MTFKNIQRNFKPSKFSIEIAKFPQIKFFAKRVVLPEISMGTSQQPTPNRDVPLVGDKLSLGSLTIDFLLQEDLQDWFKIISYMESIISYRGVFDKDPYTDISIIMYSTNDNPVAEFTCKGCFPVSITNPELEAGASNETILSTVFEITDYEVILSEIL
jgi:hypothetical protein